MMGRSGAVMSSVVENSLDTCSAKRLRGLIFIGDSMELGEQGRRGGRGRGRLGCKPPGRVIARAMPYLHNREIPRQFPGNSRVFLLWGAFSHHIKQYNAPPIIAGMGNNG